MTPSPTIAFSAFLKLAKSENVKIRNPLPFLDEHCLKFFVESVRSRYGISIPFSPGKRSQELWSIFKTSQVEVRTADCLIEIPSHKKLDETLQFSETVEVVCHPHDSADIKKLKSLHQ